MSELRPRRLPALLLLMLGDLAAFHGAFLLAYALLPHLPLVGTEAVLRTWTEISLTGGSLPAGLLVPAIAFALAGLYQPWDEQAYARGIHEILRGTLGALGLFVAVIWSVRDQLEAIAAFELATPENGAANLIWGFPVRVLVLVSLLAPPLLWIWRSAANGLERRFVSASRRPRRLIVAGKLDATDLDRLRENRHPTYRIEAVLPEGGAAGVEQLRRALAEIGPDEVFLVARTFDRRELLDALGACAEAGARARIGLGVYETLVAAARPRFAGGAPVLALQRPGIAGWTWVVKRLLDVTVASLALGLAAPLLLLACIAIVIDSKGWPVFAQERVGLWGRRFLLYKLRTMVIDADARGGPLTTGNDPRITRIGRWLRRTSIDELPQLWNVLRGDMSLVGPRAVVAYVVDNFQDWEAVSLTVRPGLTGLAQVSGRDEIGFQEKSLLNLYYVRNHSLWLDLRILVDTVGVVLSMEGTAGTRGARRTETP